MRVPVFKHPRFYSAADFFRVRKQFLFRRDFASWFDTVLYSIVYTVQELSDITIKLCTPAADAPVLYNTRFYPTENLLWICKSLFYIGADL